jgi:hypothetical protein
MRFVVSGVIVAFTVSLAAACDGVSRDDACALDDGGSVRNVQQATQYRCSTLDPGLETDPSRPDFGVASCTVIDGQSLLEHPEFCSCEGESYLPLAPEEYQAAVVQARRDGWCQGACCANLCFCELQQLAGYDLHACQSKGVRGSRNGWCYVNTARGVGTLDAIERSINPEQAQCSEPQAFVFTGDYLDGIRFMSCWR